LKIKGLSRSAARQALKDGEVTVAVYGLGKMGLPLALVLAEVGAKVVGVDIREDYVDELNRGVNPLREEPGVDDLLAKHLETGRFRATTNGVEASKKSDVIIALVPTLVDEFGIPNLTPLYDVVEVAAKGLEEGDIFILESTVPPGTSEKLGKRLEELSGLKMGEDFGVAHAPERTSSGRVIRDITESYPKIVGASDPETLESVVGFYEAVNKKGVIAVSSLAAAEAVKVFEGVYRDVNIALANELALYAEVMNIDVWEVIKAANTQPYCHIHNPGAGVGGHCIPVYPYFLIHTAGLNGLDMRILKVARRVNEEMPLHVAWLVVKALNELSRPVKGSRVLVLGFAYRPRVKEHMNTPAIPIVRRLEELGAQVYVYDPVYESEELKDMGFKPWAGEPVDVVVIVTEYDEFRDLILKRREGLKAAKALVDTRNLVGREEAERASYFFLKLGDGT